jgi:hypothetical protein
MTDRTQLQIGRLFRDVDGTLVHLKGILKDICIWTADVPTSDGALGGATHMDNFRRRFMPVPEFWAEARLPVPPLWIPVTPDAAQPVMA